MSRLGDRLADCLGHATVVVPVALIATAGLVLAGCGGASTRGSAPTITQIAQAAYVTTRQPGFRIAFTASVNVEGHSFALTQNGAMYDHGRQGAMTETIGGKSFAVIYKLPYVYVRVPHKNVRGKPWARVNIEGYAQALGASNSLSSSGDPTQWIDYLKAAGQVTTAGRQVLRGAHTTHYHVLVDLTRYPTVVPDHFRTQARQEAELIRRVTGRRTLAIDVWIDARNRVRRFQMQPSLCFQGERTSEFISIELYDYGRQTTVATPPPAAEVADLSGKVNSQTSRALQQLHC
jgi:hypothetical protein